MTDQDSLIHHDLALRPDPSRIGLKRSSPTNTDETRANPIAARFMSIGDADDASILGQVIAAAGEWNRNLPATLLAWSEQVRLYLARFASIAETVFEPCSIAGARCSRPDAVLR